MIDPDARATELAAVQRDVDAIHERIDELRERARRRALEAGADHTGSTFQETYQRDVVAHHHATRAARLAFGDVEQVVFGQLDTVDDDRLRVGRTSVIADDGEVMLVDWRADAAEPFYRATNADPMRVARRRRYVADGRAVRELDDELLDTEAAERLGLRALSGQGALLAALERTRSGHMRDIVATIQADQDRIIRSDASGTLVVTGGPGTGKTVVALHRVAYLLYTHRERLAGRGVLVVGPSRAFSTYVERVLPALGEDRAVLRSVDSFVPSTVEVVGWDDPAVAAITGSLRMVEVCARLVRASLPPVPPTTRVVAERIAADVPARPLAVARNRLLRRIEAGVEGRRYHDRAEAAHEAMLATLHRVWADEAERQLGERPDRRDVDFDDQVAGAAAVELLERCFWPTLSPVRVLGALVDGEVALDRVADGVLDDRERALLRAAWDGRRHPTGDDVALLDELEALLGPAPAERAQARRARDEERAGIELSVDRAAPRAVDDPMAPIGGRRYDGYAHVVVDEAQDLSPMQWRMVARRGAYASWTVVGDLAQRARTAEPRSWEEIARLIGRRRVTTARLTVNYRTPTEVVEVARAVLAAIGEDAWSTPDAVRDAGLRPVLVRAADVVATAGEEAAASLRRTEGTVAVIGPSTLVEQLEATVPDDDRLRVLDPRGAKGLEFDEVVVAAPDLIVGASAVGGHDLYVAVTRTTHGLTIVAVPGASVPGADACRERPHGAHVP